MADRTAATCPDCGSPALEPARVQSYRYCTRCGRGSIPDRAATSAEPVAQELCECGHVHWKHLSGRCRGVVNYAQCPCESFIPTGERSYSYPAPQVAALREEVAALQAWNQQLGALSMAHQLRETKYAEQVAALEEERDEALSLVLQLRDDNDIYREEVASLSAALEAVSKAWTEWYLRPGGDSLMDTKAQAFERLQKAIAALPSGDAPR